MRNRRPILQAGHRLLSCCAAFLVLSGGTAPSNARQSASFFPRARLVAFVFPPGQATSRQVIQWLPTGITFQSFDAGGNLVATFLFTGPVPPPADSGTWPGPVAAPENVRMNVWLFGGAPMNGQPAGVVISGFSFVPAS